MSKPESLHHDAQETQLNMAKLSWMAYQCPEDVARMYETASKTPDKLDDKWSPLKAVTEAPQYATCPASDAQAYAFKMGGCPRAPLVLACRGTSSLQDAMVDVSVQQVPFKFADGKEKDGVCVHRGFYEQFKGIMPQVDALYEGHLAGGGMLICTGHSLGSSVAALAAIYYGQQYPKQVAYLGLGTPRVGNGAFVKKFTDVVLDRTRVANGRDPVNKIPPPLGYSHIGTEVRVGRSDPYPAIPALTDLPDHDILHGYVHNLATPAAPVTAVPVQHSNWMTDVISRFRA